MRMINLASLSLSLAMLDISVSHLVPILAAWHLLFKHRPDAVGKNAVHLLHSAMFALHYNFEYELRHAVQLSIGFYLYDTARLCLSKTGPWYILHHAMTMYLLNAALTVPQHAPSLLKGYYMLEMSNVMLYVSYHVHKEHGDKPALVMASELLQLGWYAHYRIFKLTPYFYEVIAEALTLGIGACAMIAVIYVMGLGWSYRLVLKNIDNYARMKQILDQKQ